MAKIRHLMTPAPHSIGVEQSLTEAARRMRTHHIRHLPALRGGTLEGILSERDIAVVCALPLDPDAVTVEEAMSPAPYSITPDTDIVEVVQRMAESKYGSAVVVDEGHVVGIVTTTDCLGLLWNHLTRKQQTDSLRPSAVRQRICSEHADLVERMDRLGGLAREVTSGDRAAVEDLREGARALYERLRDHINLEDSILAPALRETPGFGEIREKQLLAHHSDQRVALEAHLAALDRLLAPALADRLIAFMAEVRADIQEEDADLLRPDLLRDDLITVEFGG